MSGVTKMWTVAVKSSIRQFAERRTLSILSVLYGNIHGPESASDYRADIDGLRAIAVLAVLFFHAFPKSLSGGFVGVDVFFVISGYLITGIIYRGLQRGKFQFYDFWARRIRRIFPALLITITSVYLAGWLYLLPAEFEALKGQILWGLAFSANFKLYSEVGYFDVAAELKPLLHLWSLAIEEQFYLIWPLILWLLYRSRLYLLTVIFFLTVLSYQSRKFIFGTDAAAFYMPWSRFWELQVGALLAIWSDGTSSQLSSIFLRFDRYLRKIFNLPADIPATNLLRNALSIVGFCLIAFACVKFNRSTPFPSRFTLMPVVGACFVIIAGKDAFLNKWFLSLSAMRFLGLISFPLYLWHWPLLAFARILYGTPSVEVVFIVIGLSFLLSITTYYLVEKRLRFDSGQVPWRAPALMVALGGLFFCVTWGEIKPRSNSFGVEKVNSAIGSWQYPTKSMVSKKFENGMEFWEIGTGSPRNVLFIGSSHMCQWAPAIDALATLNKLGVNAWFFEVSGCGRGVGPLDGYAQVEWLLEKNVKFDAIVWAAAWYEQYWEAVYQEKTLKILELAKKKKKRMVIVLDYATGPDFDPAFMIKRSLLGGFEAGPAFIPKEIAIKPQLRVREALFNLARTYDAEIVDPFLYLCGKKGCPTRDLDGYPLYKDGNHFNPMAAEKHLTFIGGALNILREVPGKKSLAGFDKE